MPVSTVTSKDLIEQYILALDGQPKSAAAIERFVSDPVLLQHILDTEAAFPSYRIHADQLVADADTVALRGTFTGTHTGPFAGMPATNKTISAGLMIFYRIADGRIAEHWMQLDTASLFQQLTAAS